MTIDLAAGARAITNVARRDATLLAADGRDIAVRVTDAIGPEQSVFIYMNGTAGKAHLFDGMADELAQRGVTSYSITSRTHLDEAGQVLPDVGHGIHSSDLDRVVQLATREHPDTPAAIGGTSLGAVIAMHYNATRNAQQLPVLAMSPVLLDRFLPFGDKLKLAGSLVSSRVGDKLVATPMSVGRTMTSNPASEYVTKAAEMSEIRVPARIFRDVARMQIDIARHGSNVSAPARVVLAGDDQVSVNALASLGARRAGATTEVIPGAPHELSQEWTDQRVVDAIANAPTRLPAPVPARR